MLPSERGGATTRLRSRREHSVVAAEGTGTTGELVPLSDGRARDGARAGSWEVAAGPWPRGMLRSQVPTDFWGTPTQASSAGTASYSDSASTFQGRLRSDMSA